MLPLNCTLITENVILKLDNASFTTNETDEKTFASFLKREIARLVNKWCFKLYFSLFKEEISNCIMVLAHCWIAYF